MCITKRKFRIAPGEEPDLRVEIYNGSKTDRRIALEHEAWELEIDAKWLKPTGGVEGLRRHLPLPAKQAQHQVEVWPWLWENMTAAIKELPPGKHTIRVARLLNGEGRSPKNPPQIRVVSQPVTVEVVTGDEGAATGAANIGANPVMTTQILPILQAMKQEVVKLGEEYPQLAGAKAIEAMPGEWLIEHDCRYMGKRGYENTGPFPVAIGLRVMTTERFSEQVDKVAMSFPGYRWEYLGLVGWPTLHVGEGVPPGLTGKLQEVLRNAMVKIGPLNRKALAASLPEGIAPERDRLLAAADAKIREGVRKLAKTYPLLKKGVSWEHLELASTAGCIGIEFRRQQEGKARTDTAKFPPSEAFGILVVVKPPPDEDAQLSLGALFPRLGLVGRVGTGAANPELDAALKKLVADALAPLAELEQRTSQEVADQVATKGMEFLAGIPEFRGLNLEITQDGLREIIDDHSLLVTRRDGDDSTVYHVFTPGGENVIVTFRDGECAGIQRMRPVAPLSEKATVEKADFKFEAGFIPEKNELMVGEAIYVTFYVRNTGDKPIYLATEGDGRNIRSYRFQVSATDAQGMSVRDPNPDPGVRVGSMLLGPPPEIKPGETYSERLQLARWLVFERPGEYTVRCARPLQFPGKQEFTRDYALVHPLVTSFHLKVVPRSEQGVAARIAELGERLRGEEDETNARLTAQLLGETGDPRILPDLLWAAEKWSGDSWALHQLAIFKDDPRVMALYRDALRSSRGNGRRSAAARLMGESENKEFVPDLLGSFRKEEDKFVLTSVASALGKFGDRQAVPVLKKHRDHIYPHLRLAIEQALVECGEALDVERLQAMIRSTEPNWHIAAHFVSVKAGAVAPRILAECLDFEHPEAAVDQNHANANPAYRNGMLLMYIGQAGGPQFKYNQVHKRPATADETNANRQTLRKIKEGLASKSVF